MPMPIKIVETDFPGVLIVETASFHDERGFFSETYSESIWRDAGFAQRFVQDNLSMSIKGTVRGLHYQLHPNAMGKLVRAVKGAVYDVGVDLRTGSPTYGRHIATTLRAGDNRWLWLPGGFAHGFVALEDDTIVYYKCSAMHCPEAERAVRYNDPALAIAWPIAPAVISKKDAQAPLFDEAERNFVF